MEVLKGFVESIVFKSEDTGYVVCKIRSDNNLISAVGTVPFFKRRPKCEANRILYCT